MNPLFDTTGVLTTMMTSSAVVASANPCQGRLTGHGAVRRSIAIRHHGVAASRRRMPGNRSGAVGASNERSVASICWREASASEQPEQLVRCASS